MGMDMDMVGMDMGIMKRRSDLLPLKNINFDK